jgi:hypothetical protein
MRIMDVPITTALKEIFLPPLLPVVPMVISLFILRQVIDLSSLPSILLVAGIGLLVYTAGYLSLGAGEFERQICRNVVLGTIRFAEAYRKPS